MPRGPRRRVAIDAAIDRDHERGRAVEHGVLAGQDQLAGGGRDHELGILRSPSAGPPGRLDDRVASRRRTVASARATAVASSPWSGP